MIQVVANDDDDSTENKRIDFSIISGNVADVFQIEPSTGEIIVTSALDREKQANYSLTVQATDRGIPQRSSTSIVKILVSDINDNKPIFDMKNYSVKVNESIEPGEKLISVHAFDADSGENRRIVYSILSGNNNDLFHIDPANGIIIVNESLDYEKANVHNLLVKATDSCVDKNSRQSALVPLTVNLLDVNEFTPRFHVMMYFEEIEEKQDPGHFVFTAAADDLDGGEFGIVEYNIIDPSKYFTINNKTGEVRTTVIFTYNANSSHTPYIFNVTASDKQGRVAKVPASVTVIEKKNNVLVFTQASYTFIVPGNAKKGHYIGAVTANDPGGGSISYRLEQSHEYVDINATTGGLYVIKDLQSQDSQVRKRRSLSDHEFADSLVIVASTGQQSKTVIVRMDIDRTCPGCAIPVSQSAGLSTALILVIVFAIIAVILIAIFVVLYLRSRQKRQKNPAHYSYDSSFDSLSVQPPPPPLHELPPAYNDVHSGRNTTSCDISNVSHSASSGHGSVEEEDEEIRMINATNVQSGKGLVRGQMPDSGIQQDDDALSEQSAQNHQEYFARLGIDTSKLKSSNKNVGSSVESMHQFSDEGGGEGDGTDNLPCDRKVNQQETDVIATTNLNSSQKYNTLGDTEPSHAGSLSSVVNSEEELSGSYNWDYLLDWGPQYQPLADVFAEIACLKDDAIVPKKQPTKIVPQKPNNTSLNTQPKSFPPPIITDIPPMGKLASSSKRKNRDGSESSSSSCVTANSARTSQLTSLPSLPRSPISHDSSYTTPLFSPSFTPNLSPLGTRSPSISPLVTPKVGSSDSGTPRQTQQPTLVLDGFHHSEQEQYI